MSSAEADPENLASEMPQKNRRTFCDDNFHSCLRPGPGQRPKLWRNVTQCFFSRSARHVLVEKGTRSYLTLPTIMISHSLLNVSPLQQHFLDDQRKFATFIYIRPRFATSCSTFPELCHPSPSLSTGMRNTFDDRLMMTPEPGPPGPLGKTPPPPGKS